MLQRRLPCLLGSYVVNPCLVPDWLQPQYRDEVHRRAKDLLKRATQASQHESRSAASHPCPSAVYPLSKEDKHVTWHDKDSELRSYIHMNSSGDAAHDLHDDNDAVEDTAGAALLSATDDSMSSAADTTLSLDAANALVTTFVNRHDEESLGETVQYIRETLQQPLTSFHYHALLRNFNHNVDHASAVQLLEVMTTKDSELVSLETYARAVDTMHCLAPSDVWRRILAICELGQQAFGTHVLTVQPNSKTSSTGSASTEQWMDGGECATVARLWSVMAPHGCDVAQSKCLSSTTCAANINNNNATTPTPTTPTTSDRCANDSHAAGAAHTSSSDNTAKGNECSSTTSDTEAIRSDSDSEKSQNYSRLKGGSDTTLFESISAMAASATALRSAPVLTSLLHHIACCVDSGGPVAALLVALWIRCLGVPLCEWDCAFLILSLLSQQEMFPLVRALMGSFADCPVGVVRPAMVLARIARGENGAAPAPRDRPAKETAASETCPASQQSKNGPGDTRMVAQEGCGTMPESMGVRIPPAVYDLVSLMQRALTEAKVDMTAEVHMGVINCGMITVDGWVHVILAMTRSSSSSSLDACSKDRKTFHTHMEDTNDIHGDAGTCHRARLHAKEHAYTMDGIPCLAAQEERNSQVAVAGAQASLLLRHTAMLVYSALRDHTRAVQLFVEGEHDACAATQACPGCVAHYAMDVSTLVHRVSAHTRRMLQPCLVRLVRKLRSCAVDSARLATADSSISRCMHRDNNSSNDSSSSDRRESAEVAKGVANTYNTSRSLSLASSLSPLASVCPVVCLGLPNARLTTAELFACENFWLTCMPSRRHVSSALDTLATLLRVQPPQQQHTTNSLRHTRLSRGHRTQLKQIAAYCAHHPFRNCKLTAAGLEERVKWAHYLDARDIALSLFGSARQARDSMKQLYYHQNKLPELRSHAMTAKDVRDVGRIFFPSDFANPHRNGGAHSSMGEEEPQSDESVIQMWTRRRTAQPHMRMSGDVVPRYLWDPAVYNPYPHIKLRQGVQAWGSTNEEEEGAYESGASRADRKEGETNEVPCGQEEDEGEDIFATLWRVLMSHSGHADTSTSSSSATAASSSSVWYLQDSEMYLLLMRCLLHRLDWEAAVHLTVKMQECNHYSYAMDHELTTIFSEIGDPAGCLAFKVATKLFDGRINRDGQTRREDFHKTQQQVA